MSHRSPNQPSCARTRSNLLATAGALCLLMPAMRAAADGTWVMAPPNPATGGQAFGLWLLTDGTVLSHGRALNNWVILTPDRKGSYEKGTWKNAASNPHARGGATQHVLKDGRFFQAGGEYVDGPPCTPDLCKGVEIYDPVKDMWKTAASGLYEIADTGSATLGDGRLLYSTRNTKQTEIYDPATDKWTAASTLALANGDENSWATLQNGGILAVGYKSDGAAIYDPKTDKWIRTGPVPSGFATGDTGGISLMFDGRVLVYGIGQMYIYTPGPAASDPGTWKLGPKTLNGYEAEDEYSNTLPNGKVWGGLVSRMYGPGVILQEFDPMTDSVRSVKAPPDKGNPYPIDYVNLPNGQVMVTCEQNDWIYTPDSEPQDDWRPSVDMVEYNAADDTYTLTGRQLSGLINGADEGDDMTMAENYPIVWLKDSQDDVYYARSFNFSTLVPAKGDEPQTCQFTLPKDVPLNGELSLYVSAVGVKSKDGYPFKPKENGKPRMPSGGAPAMPTAGASAPQTKGDAGAASPGSGELPQNDPRSTTGTLVSPAAAAGSGSKASGGSAAPALVDDTAPAGGTPAAAPADKSGCSCHVAGGPTRAPAHAWLGLGLVGLLGWRSRRRRCPASKTGLARTREIMA